MIRNFKITVNYEVKGLDYELRGYVYDACNSEEDIIATVAVNVSRLQEIYKGYEVKVSNVYVDDTLVF